ncbi:MAG: hypothetical protein MZW92_75385 [Comamonadaceae bacterium]|nr:hypothetical protein [Comamonadaceae bacterium]
MGRLKKKGKLLKDEMPIKINSKAKISQEIEEESNTVQVAAKTHSEQQSQPKAIERFHSLPETSVSNHEFNDIMSQLNQNPNKSAKRFYSKKLHRNIA